MNLANKQIALKPQDLVVVSKLACHRDRSFTYSQLAIDLDISASEVHACVRRATLARLVTVDDGGVLRVVRLAFLEFAQHGARYAFPPIWGSPARGMTTGYAAPPLRELIVQSGELPPVWPDPEGQTRGITLLPLYATVPFAASRDKLLYECLALLDALRAGAARERELAADLLQARL